MEGYYLYILLCIGNKLYIGVTDNLCRRFKYHLLGYGSTYTKKYKPLRFVYLEKFSSFAEARRREIQIKKWKRSKKENLIAGLKP